MRAENSVAKNSMLSHSVDASCSHNSNHWKLLPCPERSNSFWFYSFIFV